MTQANELAFGWRLAGTMALSEGELNVHWLTVSFSHSAPPGVALIRIRLDQPKPPQIFLIDVCAYLSGYESMRHLVGPFVSHRPLRAFGQER